MTFEQKTVGDVLVLTPRKNLVGGDETNELLTAIERVAAAGPARVVMDLGEINFVSSLGVGLLRKASISCRESGGWLRLARIAKIIENTLLVTGLIIYFETFETVDEAVQAPGQETPGRLPRTRPEPRPKRPEA
ncbi:MAG TPA: STAS domain-containing protein [Candidatus Krumholzibacteria bacterium]